MTCPGGEIRFTEDALYPLRDDIESRSLTRGWAVADLEVIDGGPLEWFWSPNAPVGYAV